DSREDPGVGRPVESKVGLAPSPADGIPGRVRRGPTVKLPQSFVGDDRCRVVLVRPEITILICGGEPARIKQPGGIGCVEDPFPHGPGKPIVVADERYKRTYLFKRVHGEGIIIHTVYFTDEPRAVVASPCAGDCSPRPERPDVETPVQHL